VRQQQGQATPRAIDPALDRAYGATGDIGRLLIGKTGGADHDDGLAVVGRQGVQGLLKRRQFGGPSLVGLGGQAGGVAAFFIGHFASTAGGAGVPAVSQDGEQPGPQIAPSRTAPGGPRP
jgi:hypothetical protein